MFQNQHAESCVHTSCSGSTLSFEVKGIHLKSLHHFYVASWMNDEARHFQTLIIYLFVVWVECLKLGRDRVSTWWLFLMLQGEVAYEVPMQILIMTARCVFCRSLGCFLSEQSVPTVQWVDFGGLKIWCALQILISFHGRVVLKMQKGGPFTKL